LRERRYRPHHQNLPGIATCAPLSKLQAIADGRRRIAKIHFLRICTDNEINVVVKPGQVAWKATVI
jgi:hypothetical protein